MKELNRDELLAVKGGVEIEGVTQGAFGDSTDSNGYCYGQPEDPNRIAQSIISMVL